MRWNLLALLTVVSLSASAFGQTPKIDDKANFFSESAIKKAETSLAKIHAEHKKTVIVETFAQPPKDKEQAAKTSDAKARQAFFTQWAQDRAKAAKVDGVYVLICKDPAHLRVVLNDKTAKKAFTAKDRDQLSELILSHFKKAEFDEGLLQSVDHIATKLSTNRTSTASTSTIPFADTFTQSESSSWLWNIAIYGGIALVGFMVLRSLLSAFTGGGGPGGGGFFSSLLGGMFGAAAGMWVYDQFFGNSASAADPGATGQEAYSTSGGEFDGGGGGGDFGGDWGDGGGEF